MDLWNIWCILILSYIHHCWWIELEIQWWMEIQPNVFLSISCCQLEACNWYAESLQITNWRLQGKCFLRFAVKYGEFLGSFKMFHILNFLSVQSWNQVHQPVWIFSELQVRSMSDKTLIHSWTASKFKITDTMPTLWWDRFGIKKAFCYFAKSLLGLC